MVTDVEGQPKDVTPVNETQFAVPDDSGMVLVVHEDRPGTHNNPNIQKDMELWRRICDYDKKSVEMPFTPVLT